MAGDTADAALDDETIDALLDADVEVRQYLSKVVGARPLGMTAEQWEAERPDDLAEMRQDDKVKGYLTVVSPGDPVGYEADRPLLDVERAFLDDLRDNVYEAVRDARRRTTLSPTEFAVALLSGADWSDEAIAAELDVSPGEVADARDAAHEKFRTAMRMVDLCERVGDDELAADLEGWRIHRDPVA